MRSNERANGIALIAGFVGMIITMAFHPTGREALQSRTPGQMAMLVIAVHALGLLSLPATYFGAFGLSRRLGNEQRWGAAALITFGFGAVAAMIAGAASGLIAPRILSRMLAPDAADAALWRVIFNYTGLINQAFAIIYVVASSLAILLWSIQIVRSRAMAAGLGIYGCISATLIALAVAVGHLRLDVHGFGAVVIAQAIFFVPAAVSLMRPAVDQAPRR
jgi:hypothetical protein